MRARDENKELAIRTEAMRLVVAEGFDGLSMQKLAKAAGVSPATIYIYFKDREDLIMQLCLEASEKIIAATMDGFNPDMSFEEGLRIQWKNRAAFCIENPMMSQFLEQFKHTPYYEKFGDRVKNAFQSKMSQFLMGAIKRGEMRPMQKEIFWAVCFAPLYQLVKYHIAGKGLAGETDFTLTDEIMEEAFQSVLRGLKS